MRDLSRNPPTQSGGEPRHNSRLWTSEAQPRGTKPSTFRYPPQGKEKAARRRAFELISLTSIGPARLAASVLEGLRDVASLLTGLRAPAIECPPQSLAGRRK